MMLMSRSYSGLEAPTSPSTSTAEIRNAFQQSRPRKRSKRPTGIFEIAEDQENGSAFGSPETSLPRAVAASELYQTNMTSWKRGAMSEYTRSLPISRVGREPHMTNALPDTPSISYRTDMDIIAVSESTGHHPAYPGRRARRNASARTSKRSPLGGLNGDLNASALAIDRPGANLMKENIPPGWHFSLPNEKKIERAHPDPSQNALRYGPIYESRPVFKGCSKRAQNPQHAIHGVKTTKKGELSRARCPGNSHDIIAHRSIPILNSSQILISPSISSIRTLHQLTANSITLLNYYLAVIANTISPIRTSTKRKAITMEDSVRSSHAKMVRRAVRNAELLRTPPIVLLKTIIFAGGKLVEDFPLTWEIERRLEFQQHVDHWLKIHRKAYGVRAGSLRRQFVTQPFPAANLIKDYLLCITNSNNDGALELQSLEELLLQLGCSAANAALLNKIKKLDVDFIMAVVAVLALKAQATGNSDAQE